MDYRWYAAQAIAGLEGLAVHHLSREGIAAFSPVVSERKVRLFPGYVFVELEGPLEASVVNRTRGIRKLLPRHASSPLPLPRGFVEELVGRMSRREFDEVAAEEIVRSFVADEDVVITLGPFRDHHGRFLRYRKGSAVILASLLGREVELLIPTKGLAPVRDHVRPGSRSASETLAA